MHYAQVWGDLTSDKSSENYPTVVLCNECFSSTEVVNEESWSSIHGDVCEYCGKTEEEEREEEG